MYTAFSLFPNKKIINVLIHSTIFVSSRDQHFHFSWKNETIGIIYFITTLIIYQILKNYSKTDNR